MNREILQKAIDTYGRNTQVDICIEEMSELTKALIKDRRHNGINTEDWLNIAEEIADVKIMLEQMEITFKCKDRVSEQIDYKLNRLGERLKSSD